MQLSNNNIKLSKYSQRTSEFNCCDLEKWQLRQGVVVVVVVVVVVCLFQLLSILLISHRVQEKERNAATTFRNLNGSCFSEELARLKVRRRSCHFPFSRTFFIFFLTFTKKSEAMKLEDESKEKWKENNSCPERKKLIAQLRSLAQYHTNLNRNILNEIASGPLQCGRNIFLFVVNRENKIHSMLLDNKKLAYCILNRSKPAGIRT